MITLNHPVVEEVLYQGLDDWVGLTVIQRLVESETAAWWKAHTAPSPQDIKTEALAVCAFLLSHDLMHAGELSNSTDDSGDFLDWPGGPDEILNRINRDWDNLTSLDHFEPCWFRSTPAGITAGQAVEA
ncbi:hypothetical protein GXW83_24565 [Streptacidiphilus sp. PB12-B1b]|uniref:hypothetical protein n=1 Tax=Streptacidiphilus sp. PB12-B1b TaxID=2705012 RepID=UPI0015F8B7F2|nr:hypothetical protein [Streptacidiphilus sp. PB12-B1b]QMU78405.1 hypothetical protein GXW83_24565 [Streptacidiphilus sp. PB12-B1b]